MTEAAAAGGGPDILLLSTADFDHPFWTNKQHVAVELARSGRRVLYLDSLGLRRADGRPGDLRRILRRLRRALAGPREVRPGLWVLSPLRLPGQGWGPVRRINRLWLEGAIGRAARRAGLSPRWLWTYSPLSDEQLDLRRYERVVYHCVDDIAAQPAMPVQRIEAGERRLARAADLVFVTSPVLAERMAAAGARRCILLPNVADADHFACALHCEPDGRVAGPPGPRVGFVGAVSGYKLDLALLAAVARARPGYSFVLVGPVGEGDPSTDVAPLRALANLHLLGPRPYAELPACLAAMDVAMLPAAANRYTAAMFPMKVFEYLAAGLPVVSTPLPALEPYRHLLHIAPPTAEVFAAALDRALAGEGADLPTRLAAARAHTYAGRTARMLQEVDRL